MDIRLGYEPAAVAEAPQPTISDRIPPVQRPCAMPSPSQGADLIALPRELFERLLSLAHVVDPRLEVEEQLLAWPPRPRKGNRAPTVAMARKFYQLRRRRAAYFDPMLFAEPAWDMLLDLYASELERRQVSVSSLCIAAAVPPTTALRWIGTLHDAGLFERKADPSDRRRAYIALSQKGLDGMRAYIAAVKRQGLGIA